MKVAVIGGGAAGFFAAINVKANYPESSVVLFEKTSKLLSKVRISGGGRCNVTNGSSSISELTTCYPRGTRLMKKALHVFNTTDTRDWFESRGVQLKVEADNRVFPLSDDSSSIVDCLFEEAKKLDVNILTSSGVRSIEVLNDEILLDINGTFEKYTKVIIATGGSPKLRGFQWLADLGHEIEFPVPSLFTFNMPSETITSLMGVVAPEASISIQGSKLQAVGPLLVTHWGMSGPAILKLSAFGARSLSDLNYNFKAQVNWVSVKNNQDVFDHLSNLKKQHPKKFIRNMRPYNLPVRLWEYLIVKSDLSQEKMWQDLGKKGINKLTTLLTNDIYQVKGKTTFKEEFVTCGGISLKSIDTSTMQSKNCPNLYFAGEVLDIDGITGGYNFQAAWATAFIAAKLL